MRICVGIAPDFWYDIADEYGLLFQNEWLYWQNHGWNDQIRKEYTDWVWSDGSHPSIAIWDAINENWDDYIGNKLIPELKILDPTRIWDAGYMSGSQMTMDEMDEPHPYQGRVSREHPYTENNFYPLGNLDYKPQVIRDIKESGAAQLVNEYGWIWLWRSGMPSKLTVEVFDYYLDGKSTVEDNIELQAYWMQLETEWLRSETSIAGVFAFCYLANNYGYTGDWFSGNIKELNPTETLDWFQHAFAPAAVFINLTDERYTKFIEPHDPGSLLLFNVTGINNKSSQVKGKVALKMIDNTGKSVIEQSMDVVLTPHLRKDIPVALKMPAIKGGYVLVAEFTPDKGKTVVSRRFLRVGKAPAYTYYKLMPEKLH